MTPKAQHVLEKIALRKGILRKPGYKKPEKSKHSGLLAGLETAGIVGP